MSLIAIIDKGRDRGRGADNDRPRALGGEVSLLVERASAGAAGKDREEQQGAEGGEEWFFRVRARRSKWA